MTDLVFLGAGASRPFGILTMQEMVNEFEQWIEGEDIELFNYYSEIKKTLIDTFGSSVDIEAMFSVLEGISKKVESKELGHFAFFYISKVGLKKPFTSEHVELATKILEKLKEYIKKTCTVNLTTTESTEIYEKSYVPLFKFIKGNKNYNFPGNYQLQIQWKSYTTNYDDIFEKFWNSLKTPNDHFDKQGDSDNYVFNTGRLVLSNHSFVKLHGSLDWTFNKENGNVIRKKNAGFQPYQTEGDVMLFPIQQKDLYLSPWYALFQDFKEGLMRCEKWYVIGYAFNDEFIKNVFIEQLKLRNKPTLVIVNPSANQIIQKFDKELRDKIIALPIRFGSKYFPRQFQDFAAGVRTLKIKVITSNHSIGFKSSIPIEIGILTKLDGKTGLSNMELNDSRTWCSAETNSEDYKETEFELKISHLPPYDKDLELQVGFEGKYEYECMVYFEDRQLGSKKGKRFTEEGFMHWNLSEIIRIPSNMLLVSS